MLIRAANILLLMILVITTVGFSEVNWSGEIIDSIANGGNDFFFNALALDNNDTPHVVYNKNGFARIIYSFKVDSLWQKEVIDSGFCYGYSLIFDTQNTPHLSYYNRDIPLDRTYICYACRHSGGWLRERIDSISGYLGNYFWDLYSSIDLDTSDLPGIAYVAWNVADSIHYIKFARHNGAGWNISVVEYDSACANTYTEPTDWSPSLKFNGENTPYIAFHHIFWQYDTVKIAYFDDSLSSWFVTSAIHQPYGGYPVSLALNNLSYPSIAHGLNVDVAYSWWDGASWNTESTGASMGWINVRIDLDLDSLDNPHIAYLPEPTIAHPSYCYKANNVWHLCGWIEPDSSALSGGHLSFCLDHQSKPHVCYEYCSWDSIGRVHFDGIKYAKGTFVEISEHIRHTPEQIGLQIHPNPFHDKTIIRCAIPEETVSGEKSAVNIEIYDVTGRLMKVCPASSVGQLVLLIWHGTDQANRPLPSGVYFVKLVAGDYITIEKLLLMR